MTFTSNERREVAARLRELADANEGHLGINRMNCVLRDGQAILGTSGLASVADVLRRHADLIDRPTCHDIASHGGMQPAGAIQWFECSECHCKAQTDKIGMALHFCPHCGAEVE